MGVAEFSGDDSPEEILAGLENLADSLGVSRTEVLKTALPVLKGFGLNAAEFHTLRDDA